ncbi:MAG: ATP-dependent DNA helicase RecG [Alphaproteobacteria bacterium]|nr:ATP-dependent DNA helicase RecG [Alphaproteobacteria bacterium]
MSNFLIKRPQTIFNLFSSISKLNGVGEKRLTVLKNKIGPYIINILFYLPTKAIDRFQNTSLRTIEHGSIITCEVEVVEIIIPPFNFRKKNNISRIITFGLDQEKNIRLDLIYFGQNTKYLRNIYKVGNKIVVSGKFENFSGVGQIVHPDYVTTNNQKNLIPKIETIYPLFLGFNQKFISKLVSECLKQIPYFEEWLSEDTINKLHLPNWKECIVKTHNPNKMSDIELISNYRRRLALDELIANQISMSLIKSKMSKVKTIKNIEKHDNILEKLYNILPFKLTKNQNEVVNEILSDLHSNNTMIRMLQGDVGSGKTIVALITMLSSISDGSQSVLLVPTEILAIQHFNTINEFLKPLNINVCLLLGESKGSYSKKERSAIIEDIAIGSIKIIVGTHALISEKVNYKNLSLVVIDEQHRFGVNQRVKITEKGNNVNILVMTATPIPRSLALTAYGDMNISTITEKPKGRKPIKTYVLPQSKIEDVLKSIKRAIENEALIYWVCPLIEESESTDLIAVNERFDYLKNYFKDCNISLVHGKQDKIDRENSMNDFKNGKSKILVATTVIEVGVDIPNATIMVIECAERFGLAQVHQLRGRVGRNDKESSCILLYKTELTPIAHSRLKILKDTNDGFAISEQDLILRGPGEVLGSKQSGNVDFKFVDLHVHSDLIELARKEASNLIKNDKERLKINTLLSIFENNEAIKLLKGG